MTPIETQAAPAARPAQEWVRVLAKYREPSTSRSILELALTLLPFALLWGLAWLSLSVSYWLAWASRC
jgi:acyl-lipid omega-6 desaturase (Delta-12 desaturase)